jgi:nitrate/nitrite transport system substrate-binding protein
MKKIITISLFSAIALMSAPEKKDLKIGFIPLTDCAPIIIAKEKGFFAKHGLNVTVVKEGGGWAGIQQKVASGEYDFSHMLAPMPIASTLGINGNVPMNAVMNLDYNGNAITLDNNVIADMKAQGMDEGKRPVSASFLKKSIEAKKKAGTYKPLELGMTYPTGTHNYELRYWLAAGGVNPDTDVQLKVFPPPQMVSNMQAGNTHGYCVGEPWNERAVMAKMGHAIITKYEVWNNGPEKVLGSKADFVSKNPETTKAVIKAVLEASMWLDASWENRKEASAILSKKEFVNAPLDVLDNSMTGTFMYMDGKVEPNPVFNIFANNYASYPYYSHAVWFITQMYRWGQLTKPVDMKAVAEQVYRPDLFAAAAKEVGYKIPTSPWKKDGEAATNKFLDGKVFDPSKAVDYVYSFDIKTVSVPKDALTKANKALGSVKVVQPDYFCPSGKPGCVK